jgi:phosphoribosylformylglycinamidine synthase
LIGVQVDLSNRAAAGSRLDALLFGEAQGRVLISTAAIDAVKTIERAKLLGIAAVRLGSVGGDKLSIKTSSGEYVWTCGELYDLWWNSIARKLK